MEHDRLGKDRGLLWDHHQLWSLHKDRASHGTGRSLPSIGLLHATRACNAGNGIPGDTRRNLGDKLPLKLLFPTFL